MRSLPRIKRVRSPNYSVILRALCVSVVEKPIKNIHHRDTENTEGTPRGAESSKVRNIASAVHLTGATRSRYSSFERTFE